MYQDSSLQVNFAPLACCGEIMILIQKGIEICTKVETPYHHLLVECLVHHQKIAQKYWGPLLVLQLRSLQKDGLYEHEHHRHLPEIRILYFGKQQENVITKFQ